MRLHAFTAIFMVVWFAGVGSNLAARSLSDLRKGAGTLVPIGMLAFGVLLAVGGFYPEAFKAERLIRQALAAAEQNR